jgi:phage recombination protein Bet
MTTGLATADALPKEQIDLIRRTVANGATNDELALFLYDCQRRGVHPLDKLLHFTKRGGRYTPVTSIDFMRAQAAMTGEMAGSEDPTFDEGEGHPLSATVTVYRLTQGQRFAYTATARWAEYCPDNAPMWKRMPYTMLGKCAEALALRKAFPQQLAGLYSGEEMDQAEKAGGYVVEAPAVLAEPSPGERGVQPSVPNGGDSGQSAPPPSQPPRIVKVEPKVRGAAAQLTFSTGEILLTYAPRMVPLAEQLCQSGEPVTWQTKRSGSGNEYLIGLHRLDLPGPTTETPAPSAAASAESPF